MLWNHRDYQIKCSGVLVEDGTEFHINQGGFVLSQFSLCANAIARYICVCVVGGKVQAGMSFFRIQEIA